MIGNNPSFSVSDFVAVFNQVISGSFGVVEIFGEVANFNISKGKWVYFDLKDDNASIKFFGSIYSLPGPIENGMTVEVVGKPNLHPQFNFSVQFSSIAVKGEGGIARAYKLLYAKLNKEGLFDIDRKRDIPEIPEKIGLIASKESAGYQDFIKIINNRWPIVEVHVYDTLVQGVDAPDQIIKAINQANNEPNDLLVITRGGGSRDDLLAFDDERVVRSIALSRTPTVVAIGHERDEVLSELVADLRASTPSNAAEIIVPNLKDEQQILSNVRLHLKSVLNNFESKIFEDIERFKIDLDESIKDRINSTKDWLLNSQRILTAYDPNSLLKKGFIFATDNSNKLIKTSLEAVKIKNFNLNFRDGSINVEVRDK